LPREVCGDPERLFYPQRAICWATANQAAAARRYEQMHHDMPFHDGNFANWSKNASLDAPYRYDDGVTIWVSPDDITPDDHFLSATPEWPDDDDEVDGGNSA
jgi:hypothetical protein